MNCEKTTHLINASLLSTVFLIICGLAIVGTVCKGDDSVPAPKSLIENQPPYCTCFVLNGLCYIGIYGRTNSILYRPLREQSYDAQLFDETGSEIPKTTYGKRFGLPLEADQPLLDGSWRTSMNALYGDSRILDFSKGFGSSHEWDFDVKRSFRIKENGTFRLKVQVRLFKVDSNNFYRTFLLPPVETTVKSNEKGVN